MIDDFVSEKDKFQLEVVTPVIVKARIHYC